MLFIGYICFLGMMMMEVMAFFFVVLGMKLFLSGENYYYEWMLMNLGSLNLSVVLIFDYISCIFLGLVLFISGMVIYYSSDYMEGDKSMVRFIGVVMLFVLSMGLMILSPNMVSILLGWDGLGLVSYVLVIYYDNEKSSASGMLTVMSNRVGDVLLLLCISWMFNFGSWNFIFYLECMQGDSMMNFLSWLVFLGAITKSAQIPFSAWLPAAMAAPTPVSALVHSSTLVTAGVYLMIRFFPLYSSEEVRSVMMFLSLLTMLMSSFVANYEVDLKKVIALSTLSQLGLMILCLSLGMTVFSFFHLLTHALFKSMLFLCAGVVIHGVFGYQDVRKMGGLLEFLPTTVICMGLSSLALGGFPFLAGFYSKDLILECSEMMMLNMVVFFFFLFSVGLTMMYSFRVIYYSVMGESKLSILVNISEGKCMSKSMLVLSGGSVFGGAVLGWMLLPDLQEIVIPTWMKYLVLGMVFLGGLMGYYLGFCKKELTLSLLGMFFGKMWFMSWASGYGMSFYSLFFGNSIYQDMDVGWGEFLGVKMISSEVSEKSTVIQWSQMNLLYLHMFLFFVLMAGLVVL
uniref:NADH-ubiquinone oxidoreductase chain 5 n=1 Tax=Lepidocampa weberi TaxID=165470 RepID=U3KTN7_9HEXA|nr:NADH dehydrogenase subunit 5 [Lepidocampa weberi]AEV44880.1 NADH dehydrogenase subunit 5 [Lepidocampa weberi]